VIARYVKQLFYPLLPGSRETSGDDLIVNQLTSLTDPITLVFGVGLYRLLKQQHKELKGQVDEINERLRHLEESHMLKRNSFGPRDDDD